MAGLHVVVGVFKDAANNSLALSLGTTDGVDPQKIAAAQKVYDAASSPLTYRSRIEIEELFAGARKVRTGFDELKGKTPTRGSPSEWAAFLQQMKEDQDRMDQHIRPFEEGLPSSYNAQIVMRVNSLQMLYAERWIVSSKPDFSLPMKMLADDPTLRERRKLEVE